MGLFRTIHKPFADFLERMGQDRVSPVCFQARNFLLDENVLESRARSYGKHGASGGFADEADWTDGHTAYLKEQVFLARPKTGMPGTLNPANETFCPQTFRQADNFVTYGGAHQRLDLLRVVSLVTLERRTGQDRNRIADAGREILRAGWESRPPDVRKAKLFDGALRDWNATRDLRPCFSSFYVDHEDILKNRPEDDAADWADELRDRLGLAHLAPGNPPEIPILVFCYGVGEVPKTGLRELKPLAVPSVLDGDLSPAFCPAPPNPKCGHTVHLGARTPSLCREVVHPYMDFEARHLFRVGVVKRTVPEDLWPARKTHLLALRQEFGRADYAAATDPEL